MDRLDFEKSDIRGWTHEGMLSTYRTETKTVLKRAKACFVSLIVGAAIAVGQVQAAQAPSQLSFLWPSKPDATHTKQRIADSLQRIKEFHPKGVQFSIAEPDRQSLQSAAILIPQLPNIAAEAAAGVDEDGLIYFRFQQGSKVAVVTIGVNEMHALYMEPGQESVHIEDEEFRGKKLPAKIKKLLETKMTAQ